MRPSSDSISNNFFEDELLFRAVLERPPFLKNGRLSSAAFKDKKGLSVERGYHRPICECVKNMRTLSKLKGPVFSVSIKDCAEVNAVVKYLPTENPYHSEIHGSETEIELDDLQALVLSRHAKFVTK